MGLWLKCQYGAEPLTRTNVNVSVALQKHSQPTCSTADWAEIIAENKSDGHKCCDPFLSSNKLLASSSSLL